MKIVNILGTSLKQLLHNPVCWSCGLAHQGQPLTCRDCRRQIQFVQQPCLLCGLSHQGEQRTCAACQAKPARWQKMVAPLSYQAPIDQLILQLKFNQKLEVLRILAELVEPSFKNQRSQPQLLLPVPLHQNRYLERGFNQALEIVKLLSKALNIPYSDQLILRVKDTPKQSTLTLKQRQKNLKNSFYVDEKIVAYQSIALVDDVITTGSTLTELSKQCAKVGVENIQVWALARTERG